MAISNQYDVVIIGCGIAGSVAGALLSEKARKKVLILEGSSQVGGRATSFRGEGIKDAASFRKTLGLSAHCWVHDRSEPSLEGMIEKKMLDGYVIETGGRGSWYANRGRVSQALAVFNKASIFYPNVGFVWFDHDWNPFVVKRHGKIWLDERF